jgi:hypothetical protein
MKKIEQDDGVQHGRKKNLQAKVLLRGRYLTADWTSGRSLFQVEGTAGAKALRQEPS